MAWANRIIMDDPAQALLLTLLRTVLQVEARSETKKRYNESEQQMITKQLKRLCIVKNCFIFESRVYELLYTSEADRKRNLKMNMKHKYRFMISDDDYDYVTDSKLRKRLDRFITKER